MQLDAARDRAEALRDRSRGSGSRRTSASRASGTSARRTPAGSARRAARARSSRRRAARRRSTARRSARTAGSCRVPPTASFPRTAPRPDRRSSLSSVGMFGDGITHGRPVSSKYISRRQPSIGTTSSAAPMPNSSLNSRASSPIVMPWRIGIGNCPTNDVEGSAAAACPSTAIAADRVRPVAHDDPDAVPRRGAHAVGHRVDEGVDAGADVLQVDDQHVDVAQHLRGRLARLAVERVDRHAPPRVVGRAASRSCCPAGPSGTRAAGRRAPPARRRPHRAGGRRCA